jgi:hypothetical protein
MPNWCSNTLTITGKKEELEKFKKQAEVLTECEPTIYEGEGVIRYAFDTAWSPPTEWLYKVAPQFPELTFKLVYREDGMTFMGMDYYEGGELVDSQDINTDSVWQEVNADGLDPDSDEYMERVEELLDEMENNL